MRERAGSARLRIRYRIAGGPGSSRSQGSTANYISTDSGKWKSHAEERSSRNEQWETLILGAGRRGADDVCAHWRHAGLDVIKSAGGFLAQIWRTPTEKGKVPQ